MAEAERGALAFAMLAAAPCLPALTAARCWMNMLGVMPQHRLKCRPKWL
jgi:hypothetical protein